MAWAPSRFLLGAFVWFLVPPAALPAGGPENTVIAVNDDSPLSRRLGAFYTAFHQLPASHVCHLHVPTAESIDRPSYRRQIEQPLEACLRSARLIESTYYLVLTQDLPLRILPTVSTKEWIETDGASVDSELALLYARLHGLAVPTKGPQNNPFFERRNEEFRHPAFSIYLVTRLAGYSFEDARAAVERCRGARNTGVAVIDLKAGGDADGDHWLRNASIFLPANRVLFEETSRVVSTADNVIAYASWGSNDENRHSRKSGMKWLPGAIAAEYVSSNARTFANPPANWTLGTWKDAKSWFAGSPQSLILDYVWEGVSGVSGNVDEPYLAYCVRPHILLPAYLGGRNLAESYYLALPVLSWQSLIVGDPLCRLN